MAMINRSSDRKSVVYFRTLRDAEIDNCVLMKFMKNFMKLRTSNNEGGLGIHTVKEVACAAFPASVLTFLQSHSLTKMLKYLELDLSRFIEKTISTLKRTWED
jgi:hypothetical protein